MSHTSTTTLRGPAPAAQRLVDILDRISVASGKAASTLVVPMMCILVYEVISRYFFNAPTIWAGDLALILYGIYFMVASPYCLKDGMHIRTDFLYNRWSNKTKGLVDTVIYVFLYLPTHVLFLEIGWKYFYKSFRQNESIVSSPWMPIIWPMKFAIPLSVFLMILQGLSETIKSYYAWRHGVFYWENDPHGENPSVEGETCEAQI